MKRYFSFQNFLLIGGLLFTLAFISACNDDDDNIAHPDVAGFMAFNLATDQPAIGVALSGNNLNTPLPYMSYTGGYVAIYPGKRSTDAFDAGGNTLTTTTHTYAPNHYYSLFVIGMNGNYQNVIVNDGLDTLNASKGSAYVRYINAIQGSNLHVTIQNDSATLLSGQPSFGMVSDFAPVNAGAVTVAINNGSDIAVDRNITLEGQKAYTLLLAGNPAGSNANDSVQIRYIINGKVTIDSTKEDLSKESN